MGRVGVSSLVETDQCDLREFNLKSAQVVIQMRFHSREIHIGARSPAVSQSAHGALNLVNKSD